MLKNKIIALFSVVTMMFSLATVANAEEKTPIITDPTFFIDDLGYVEDFGSYLYAVGVSYDEFGTTNPFTYTQTGKGLTAKFSGIGFAMANIKLEGFTMTEDTMIAAPDLETTYDLYMNGLLNFTLSGTSMVVPDTSCELSDKGAVFFVIVSPTEVDLSKVTCSDVTLFLQDFGTEPAKAPTVVNDWTYSSDSKQIELGNADFLAYTAPAASDDDDEEAKTTMDKPVAGNDMYGMKTALTKITFNNVENPVVKLAKDGEDSGKSYDLPANVKGGATEIIGIIRYAADVTGEFVLSVFDGETEVVSTSYIAE